MFSYRAFRFGMVFAFACFRMAKGDFNGDDQSADLYGRDQHLGSWRGDANWAGISAGDRDDCRRQ